MKIIYALKEINTGLFYSQELKDITELSLKTKLFEKQADAILFCKEVYGCSYSYPHWYTTLSAIERMYDKPIMEVELNYDLLRDTASLFEFKVVTLELSERCIKDE